MRLENLFLRKQLEIAARSSPKPKIRPTDRFFLGLLTGPFESWRDATWILKPDTLGPPRFLLRDRNGKFGELFTETVRALAMDPLLTAYASPWQNGYVERLIGSIRRECLDHVIVLNESHLRGILQQYVRYYNMHRTHLGIDKDSPEGRAVQADGRVEKTPVVGGLHHYYFRRAA